MADKIFVMGQEITLEETQPSGVLVYLEIIAGEVNAASATAIKLGRIVADKIGVKLSAIVLGTGPKSAAGKPPNYAVDEVITKDGAEYGKYDPALFVTALREAIAQVNPEVLLFGQSQDTRDLAARIAQSLRTGLVCNCIDLDVDVQNRLLLMKRVIFNGLLTEELICPASKPQIAALLNMK